MDEAKEFLSGILKTVRDRLGNPLVSAFAIAWVIWNYRFLLVIFGGGGYEAKLKYLDTNLGVGTWQWMVFNGLGPPLLIALIWIFLMPKVLRLIAVHHAEQANLTKREELKVLGRSPISQEDRIAIQEEIFTQGQAWQKERHDYQGIITSLQKDIEILRNPPAPAQATPSTSLPSTVAPPRSGSSDETLPPGMTADQVKALSGLDPFNIPSDSNTEVQSPDQLALRLNLKTSGAMVRPSESSYDVSFFNRSIVWPWRVGDMSGSGLPPSVIELLTSIEFDEASLLLLDLMRTGSEVVISETGKIMGRFDNMLAQRALRILSTSDLAQKLPNGRYKITSSGRLFLLWLQRIGIMFHVPNRKR